MNDLILIFVLVAVATCTVMLVILIARGKGDGSDRLEQVLREELRLDREESSQTASALRQEVCNSQKSSSDTVVKAMEAMGGMQKEQLQTVSSRISELTTSNLEQLEKLRGVVDGQLKSLQQSNETKLEQMRSTVDEKLQSTLEKRLGESFKLVNSQLEAVQRGLGEMQTLATGVGDLKRVLTNVKARGTWGEVQLEGILEQVLTPDQFDRNVKTKVDSDCMVEYAICLPGMDDQSESTVWLPVDAKFPQEDYLRLVEASEVADVEAVKKAQDALMRSIEASAKDIQDKYVDPPNTTDFAIMFLPTEGLYAEVLRQPGALERMQQRYRIVIAGPTTLSAILNSLRMGFRTLAIEKRSSEVWQILAAVKTEFGKFGDVLTKVKKQLRAAGNTIEETERRTRVMSKRLRDVEQLPDSSAEELLLLRPDIESSLESEEEEESDEEEVESTL